jgi:hypothetical protein
MSQNQVTRFDWLKEKRKKKGFFILKGKEGTVKN